MRARGGKIKTDLFAIGWDVRGWQSHDQATAVARLRAESKQVEWIGISEPFQLKAGCMPTFEALVKPAIGTDKIADLRASEKLAIAIDAPLAFPNAFGSLLHNKALIQNVPEREIENRLAYRDCERWVEKEFGKKPLSAPFDKLGNNASLALTVAYTLLQDGFEIIPQTAKRADRAVIEVYPALVKSGPRKTDPAILELASHLPGSLKKGTDQYDAAICAVLALIFLGGGALLDLPDLVLFPDGADPKEGWIFTFPPQVLRRR